MSSYTDLSFDPVSSDNLLGAIILTQNAYSKWNNIGLALQVPSDTLWTIKMNTICEQECFCRVILAWLQYGKDTSWEVLAEAMDKAGRRDLKKKILQETKKSIDVVKTFWAEAGTGDDLSDRDLLDVYTYVYESRPFWYCLGLVLGCPFDFLEEIKTKSSDVSECLRKLLIHWLRNGKNRSWKTIALAVGEEIAGKSKAKEKIWQERVCSSSSKPNAKKLSHVEFPLSHKDLEKICTVLDSAADDWYNIGLVLGLHCTILDEIETASSTSQECQKRMLEIWLKDEGREKSWTILDLAMGHVIVNQTTLESSINEAKRSLL